MNPIIAESLLPGFELELYKAAHQNLADQNNPLRLSNFAYAMRELVRHLLERLAPSDSVVACEWYRNQTSKPNGVTRRQRAYFSVQGGLSDDYVCNVLSLETADIHQAVVQAIDRLSKFTHIEPEVFSIDQGRIDELATQTEQAVADLLSTISECRNQIISALWHQIDEAVVLETIRETIGAIDEIATHHSIDEVYVDKILVAKITHDRVMFLATGTIGAELQWGSNSDIRNDMGAVMSESFPFECSLFSWVSEPDELEVEDDSLLVDTSKWYGRYGEDEV
jgi:hypothetical protein